MSVATMLGVEDVEGPAMKQARQQWDGWTTMEPDLEQVVDLLHLRNWTRTADANAKDAALRALAKLGSSTGHDDPAATTALTWALIPGAATVAYRLSDRAPNIDELVASHLWTSAKTFAWESRRCVAASILRDTRRGVQAEFGIGEGARRDDRTWSETVCLEPASPTWQHLDADASRRHDAGTAGALDELLEYATCAGVITEADRGLLIELVMAAAETGNDSAVKGRGGLASRTVTETVAARCGIDSRSVRRRAAKSIDRLSAFACESAKKGHHRWPHDGEVLALGA